MERERAAGFQWERGQEMAMQHNTVSAAGASFHVVTAGSGPPLLLLHGWPEFWLTWAPVMARLAARQFTPDRSGPARLRRTATNRRASRMPSSGRADAQAADLLALLDGLGIEPGGHRRPRCRRRA